MDYECNDYSEQWDFEHWGIRYWSRTPEFEVYLKDYKPTVTIREERITAEDMNGYRTGAAAAERK